MEFVARGELIGNAKQVGKIKFNFDCTQILKRSRIMNEVLTQTRLAQWI